MSFELSDMEQVKKGLNELVNDPDETKRIEIIGTYDDEPSAMNALNDLLHNRITSYTKGLRDGTISFPNFSELNHPLYRYAYVTLFGDALNYHHNGIATIKIRINNYP